jgi:hypothetical protein
MERGGMNMKLWSAVSKSALAVLLLVLALACAASADTIYNVSGTFGNTIYGGISGPLNGGSFDGTFSATLPITSGTETITTFDINLLNSSGTILVSLTNSTVGDTAAVAALSSDCYNGTAVGACDEFYFTNFSGKSNLYLTVPVGFTGGAVAPTPAFSTLLASSLADDSGLSSAVASGSIEPASAGEPGTFLMLGLALMAGLWIGRKRLLAKSMTV